MKYLPGYEYVVSSARDLFDRVEAGDALEVSVGRCDRNDIEFKDGFVAVLYKGEVGEDGKDEFCIGLSPIAETVEALEIRRGSVYRKGDRELVLAASEDEVEDPAWFPLFPVIIVPGAVTNIGVRYRHAVETILAAAF